MSEIEKRISALGLINLLENGRSGDFASLAAAIYDDGALRERIQMELLNLAKGENCAEDLRVRRSAVNIMGLLGFTNHSAVRHELFLIFNSFFDKAKLITLATIERKQKAARLGTARLEMRFLRSLLLAMLQVRDEPGLTVGQSVVEVFDGTDFGKKVAKLLRRDCDH